MRNDLAIVLDTTYILPIFNIEVDVFRKKDFNILINIRAKKMLPSQLIIEAKWVLYSLIRKGRIRDINEALKDFNDGLRFLMYRNFLSMVNLLDPEIDLLEGKIYKICRIKDYFDRIILAVAKFYDAILLTEDKDLLNLDVEKYSNLIPRKIMNWKTLKKRLLK